MDLNRVLLTGRLDGEPLIWQVGDHPLATLRLMRHACEAFQLTAWEELAEWCGRALRAGDHIYAEGRRCVAADGRHEVVLDRVMLLARPTPPAASAAVIIAERQAA